MGKALKNKNVLVLGLGLHGGGVDTVRFLLRKGARVKVSEKKTRKELLESLQKLPPVKGTFGKESLKDIDWADLVVKNPGVPKDSKLLLYAVKKNKEITSNIELFYDAINKRPEIAITGSRGKSTTTSLVGSILSTKGEVFVGGNNRVAVLSGIHKAKKNPIVLELSSWQIEDAFSSKISPHIAALTCLYPEHLNRYSSFQEYKKAKIKIFQFQTKDDFAILNFDQKETRLIEKKVVSQRIYFSLKKLPKKFNGSFVEHGWLCHQENGKRNKVIKIDVLPLYGSHNIANTLCAIAIARAYSIPFSQIKKGIVQYEPLPGRFEVVGKKKNIEFINDTTSTSPDALIAALKVLHCKYPATRKAIIVGGSDKNLSYTKLRSLRLNSTFNFYILNGSASKKIKHNLLVAKDKKITFNSLEKALARAYQDSIPQASVIVLSPGAASFGMFKHEFDRGDAFNNLVKKL